MAPTLLVPGHLDGHPREVPVDVITAWVRDRLPGYNTSPPTRLADRVAIVKSKTGSGKSTVLPAHLFRLLRDPKTPRAQKFTGRSLICTQPRVLTAVRLARDMAEEGYYPELHFPETLQAATGATVQLQGGTIGYQTGPVTSRPARGLVYATAGTLLAQLRDAATRGDWATLSDRYAIIVVDEAHEQSMDIEALLMAIKQMLLRGIAAGGESARQLPVVLLASATIEVDVYADYFELRDGVLPAPGAGIFNVGGRQYQIETRWPPRGTNDYPAEAARVAAEFHNVETQDDELRDVLVFMPGAAETRATVEALRAARGAGALDAGGAAIFLVVNREVVNREGAAFALLTAPAAALWGALRADPEAYAGDRAQVLDGLEGRHRDGGGPPRRIIVATVVAETGLTVPTLRCVIDSGWSRTAETYPGYVRGLLTRPAPRSRVQQRMGRAGRKGAGVFMPLYTRAVYEALPEQQEPEVVQQGLGPAVLDVVLASGAPGGAFDPARVDMLNPPPADVFAAAMEGLAAAGFFSAARSTLTASGVLAAGFTRLPLAHRRLLMGAALWNCAASDLATAAAVAAVCQDRGLNALLGRKAQTRLRAVRGYATGDADPRALAAERDRALEAGLPAQARAAGPALARRVREQLRNDVLEGVLVFEGWARKVQQAAAAADDPLAAVEEWCDEVGLNYGQMSALAEQREAAMEDMAHAGLNAFWGEERRLADAPADEFEGRAADLTQCMYDAYRLNGLAWAGGGHVLRGAHPVAARPPFDVEGTAVFTPQVVLARAQPGGRAMRWALEAPLVASARGTAYDPALLRADMFPAAV